MKNELILKKNRIEKILQRSADVLPEEIDLFVFEVASRECPLGTYFGHAYSPCSRPMVTRTLFGHGRNLLWHLNFHVKR
jgi:hypothetical protein